MQIWSLLLLVLALAVLVEFFSIGMRIKRIQGTLERIANILGAGAPVPPSVPLPPLTGFTGGKKPDPLTTLKLSR